MKTEVKSMKLQSNFQHFNAEVKNNQMSQQKLLEEINNINKPIYVEELGNVHNEVNALQQEVNVSQLGVVKEQEQIKVVNEPEVKEV